MKKLGFGCMRLPLAREGDQTAIDIEQFKQMVDMFMEKGFTYFDTAYPYHAGKSELAVAEALVKRYPRNSYTIADKLPMFSLPTADKLEPIFEEQLRKLGVDYIDYYLLHNLHGAAFENAEATGAFELVRRKKAEGKIRHIGFSIHDTADRVEEILTKHPEMEFVQIQLNYVDWENAGIQARKCYEVCRKFDKPVIVMEPVKGGTLLNLPDEAASMFKEADPNMSLASWSIRYAASLEGVMVVLSGMSNVEQMADNLSYMDDFKPLTNSERAVIGKAVDMVNSYISVPCTACGYCVKGCPKNIPIPAYFALYNAEKQDSKHAWKSQGDYYAGIGSRGAFAGDCIKCGKCESVCPQHLEIRKLLCDVAQTFGK